METAHYRVIEQKRFGDFWIQVNNPHIVELPGRQRHDISRLHRLMTVGWFTYGPRLSRAKDTLPFGFTRRRSMSNRTDPILPGIAQCSAGIEHFTA